MYLTFPSFHRHPPDGPQHRFLTLPLSLLGFPRPCPRVWVSHSGRRLTATPGRIAFVILRTDGSPPVALDPASRRRRYLRLQAGERLPGGDLHPSDPVHFQTHCHGRVGRAIRRFASPGTADTSTFAIVGPHAVMERSSSMNVLRGAGSLSHWWSPLECDSTVCSQNRRRTIARASEKVMFSLWYQGVERGRTL
jgi:hypothetical protein